jgi:hypothetical protein
MNIRSRPSRGASPAAALDPDLLRSGSILIDCRSSFILSALVFTSLLAKVYSDLYVHLIRQTARTLARASVPPVAFFALLLAGLVAFYRRYPNVLKLLRSPDLPEADGRIPPSGRMD